MGNSRGRVRVLPSTSQSLFVARTCLPRLFALRSDRLCKHVVALYFATQMRARHVASPPAWLKLPTRVTKPSKKDKFAYRQEHLPSYTYTDLRAGLLLDPKVELGRALRGAFFQSNRSNFKWQAVKYARHCRAISIVAHLRRLVYSDKAVKKREDAALVAKKREEDKARKEREKALRRAEQEAERAAKAANKLAAKQQRKRERDQARAAKAALAASRSGRASAASHTKSLARPASSGASRRRGGACASAGELHASARARARRVRSSSSTAGRADAAPTSRVDVVMTVSKYSGRKRRSRVPIDV